MMAGAASLHREDVDMARDHPKHFIPVIEKNGTPRVDSQAARPGLAIGAAAENSSLFEGIAHSFVTSRA